MIEVYDAASGTTLAEFAGMTEAAVSAGLTAEVLRGAAKKGSQELGSWMHTAELQTVNGQVGRQLVGMLHENMVDIFAGVWSSCVDLKRSAEQSLKSTESSTVVLTDHEFSYEVQPEIDVLVNGVSLGAFKFVVKILCKVEALAVQLEKGCITGVRAGSCAGGGAITLAGQEVWKREFLRTNLPGELRLTKPVRLA